MKLLPHTSSSVLCSSALFFCGLATAQHVTVPSTCLDGFTAGVDTVLYTIPYTYAQTLSIIGSYRNLTWSGNPPDTVALNGSDNTVGTARTYTAAGAHVIETLLIYDSPGGNGPYYEVHNLAQLTVPPFNNVTLYASYDGTTVTSVCDDRASMFNFTAVFCATDLMDGIATFHAVHTADAMGAQMLLGNATFTSCDDLGNPAMVSATATSSGQQQPVQTFTGGAAATTISVKKPAVVVAIASVVAAWVMSI